MADYITIYFNIIIIIYCNIIYKFYINMFNGSKYCPMSSHEFPWVPMSSHEFSWVPMSSHEFPWVPMSSHEFPCFISGERLGKLDLLSENKPEGISIHNGMVVMQCGKEFTVDSLHYWLQHPQQLRQHWSLKNHHSIHKALLATSQQLKFSHFYW